MNINYIYIFIGISTLALNLALTLNIIRKHAGVNRKEMFDYNDVITFKLTGRGSDEGATTVAAPYDDTMSLE